MTEPDRANEADTEAERIRARVGTILHPVRSLVMSILAVEPSLGVEELAQRLGMSAHAVRRHIGQLVDERLVRIDREEGRRGVVKRYYRMCGPLQIDSQEDGLLTDPERRRVSIAVIRTMVRELLRAAARPEMARRSDRVLVNVPGVVDERGWSELSKLHHETLRQVQKVMGDARERLGAGAQPIRVISQQVLLETSGHQRSLAERQVKNQKKLN